MDQVLQMGEVELAHGSGTAGGRGDHVLGLTRPVLS